MSYKISAQCMTDKNLKKLERIIFFRADQAENVTLGYMYLRYLARYSCTCGSYSPRAGRLDGGLRLAILEIHNPTPTVLFSTAPAARRPRATSRRPIPSGPHSLTIQATR